MTQSKHKSKKPKILLFTSTRAEYGLLRWTLQALRKRYETLLAIGGSHLSPSEGYTISEILKDDVGDYVEIPFLPSSNTPEALSASVGTGIIQMAQIVARFKPDFVALVGDRYEQYIPLVPAVMNAIPILHFHGGEQTEGAMDEQIRHAITKCAHIHFVSSLKYAQNVSRMGEEDWRIFVVGALGLENIKRTKSYTSNQIFAKTGVDVSKPTVVCTFHPETVKGKSSVGRHADCLLLALSKFDFQVVFTRPNTDVGSEIIIKRISKAVSKNPDRYFLFDSLGTKLYHSMVKKSLFVIGNSSSALIEAPFLKVPSIDIGDREQGRIKPASVISSSNRVCDIVRSIETAMFDEEFRQKIRNIECPFGNGDASAHILSSLNEITKIPREKLLKKTLDFTENASVWHTFW